MSILAQCPFCRRKQAVAKKICLGCGHDLDRAKRSKKVRYWVSYRLPGGRQRREYVGTSIEAARDADSKRRVQRRENRFMEILIDSKITLII